MPSPFDEKTEQILDSLPYYVKETILKSNRTQAEKSRMAHHCRTLLDNYGSNELL